MYSNDYGSFNNLVEISSSDQVMNVGWKQIKIGEKDKIHTIPEFINTLIPFGSNGIIKGENGLMDKIDTGMFYGIEIPFKVIIPSSVNKIEDDAFKNCKNL